VTKRAVFSLLLLGCAAFIACTENKIIVTPAETGDGGTTEENDSVLRELRGMNP
jgi:hypothetical protein